MVEAEYKLPYTPGDKRRDLGKYEKNRFDQSFPAGGLILDDSDSSVIGVLKQITKQMAKDLASGKVGNLMKITTPAHVHLDKSYLHMIVKEMSYMEYFIREAMTKPDDHQWKIKNIVLAQLTALLKTVEQGSKSPLNPILGETLHFKSKSGVQLFCEQTSHHPPISHFLIEGPADCAFKIHGYIEYKVQVDKTFSSVTCSMPGKITLELPEGSKYSLQVADCMVEQLLKTQKSLNMVGEIELRDLTNMLVARVYFDHGKSKRKTGMMRFVTGSDKLNKDGVYENRRDLIKIEVI